MGSTDRCNTLSEAPPDRLFPALLNKLQDDSAPLILIFEDVHWADNATLDLVKYLGRRIGMLRAMVVLTARSDEIGRPIRFPMCWVTSPRRR